MKAIIYFSLSKNKNSKKIASTYEGDVFEIINNGKVYKSTMCNMIVYGFKTVTNRNVSYESPIIDFSKYDEVVLVSPVWAGKINLFMKKYLEEVPFENKKVIVIGSSDGGAKNYFASFKNALHKSNEIIEEVMYEKGKKV